jgi:hypothetical protein
MEEHTGKWRTDAGDQTRAWYSGGIVVASNPLDIKLQLHPPIFRFPTLSLSPSLWIPFFVLQISKVLRLSLTV